jgi:hypothetical protein
VPIKCTREFHQGLFWVYVKTNLDDLGLEIEVRGFIEAALAETVPKPAHGWALWGVKCIPHTTGRCMKAGKTAEAAVYRFDRRETMTRFRAPVPFN